MTMCATRQQHGLIINRRPIDGSSYWVSYFALWETLLQTGFRKSEVAVQHVDLFDPSEHPTRASLAWCIRGVIIYDPTPEDLANLGEGDYAILTPPPSKTDQFGVIWGDKPIYLPVRSRQFMCAALRLRDLELILPARGDARAKLPLFTADDGRPFTFYVLNAILRGLKDIALPASVDSRLYTYHSCRIYLCTALGAAGKSPAEIQALCRWQSVASLQIYNRMQPADYIRHLDDASGACITSYSMVGYPIISSRQLSDRISAEP